MPTLPIVGARFRPPAEDVLRMLPSGAPLILRRQPDNPYDANAVQVLLPKFKENYSDIFSATVVPDEAESENGWAGDEIHLGFIPREYAVKIALLMDQQDLNEDGTLPDVPGVLSFTMTGQPAVTFGEKTEASAEA